MGLAKALTSFLQIALGTSVLSYLFLFYLSFYSLGLFWALFASYVYPDELGSPMFLQAFGAIHLFVTVLFNTWLVNYSRGYAAAINNYLTSLKKIEDWTDRIDMVTSSNIADRRHDQLDQLGVIASFILIHLYKMHAMGFSYDMDEILKNADVEVVDDSPLGSVLAMHNSEWNDKDMNKTIEIIRNMKKQVYKTLFNLYMADVYDGSVFRTLFKPIAQISQDVDSMVIGWLSQDPPIQSMTYKLIFTIYFTIFLPINIWAQAGTFLGPFAFGLGAVVMLTPVIYSMWLKDPFDPDRPVLVVDHDTMTRTSATKIVSMFYPKRKKE